MAKLSKLVETAQKKQRDRANELASHIGTPENQAAAAEIRKKWDAELTKPPVTAPSQSRVNAVEDIWDRGSTTGGSKATATSNLANQITDLENRRKAMEAERSSIYSSLSDPATFDRSKLSQLGNYDAEIQSIKDQMEELSKIRPEYKTEEAEARYKTYTNAEERIKSKYGSVEALVKDLETRAADLDRQTEKLKQLEAQYKENPSEKLYTEYTKAYEGYTKAAKTYQGLYLDYQPLQQAWQDYEAYDVAAQGKAGAGETAKRIAQAGITQVGSALWQTAALGEKALGSVLPGISTPITDEANRVKAAAERNALAVKEATHGHGKMAELGGDVGVAAIAAVPQAVLAFLTRGQSLAESSLVSGIGPNAGLAGSLMNTIKSAMKNPSYLASMAQTLGPDFQEAKNAGASDLEAAATALIASSINAGVEIGGGLEKLGDADGTLVERILKSGHEEGWEEVLQGIISGTVNKGIYDFDKPIASLTDQNAILNPQRMATEYGTGAAVGMLLSGGTEVLASGARKATNKALGSVEARPIEKPAQLSPAADPAVQQVQARAEITQAQNPESDVLDAATTLFTQQGMNLKTAQKRAEIVGKLVRGEEVSDKDLNRIDPTSAQTKRIFTQLTGVQFPEGKIQIEQLRNIYRSAHEVAQVAKTQIAEAAATTVAENATVESPLTDEQILERAKEARTRANPDADKKAAQILAQTRGEIAPDGTALLSYKDFAARHKQVFPDASPQETARMYDLYLRDNQTVSFMGRRVSRRKLMETLNSAPDSDKMTPEERAAVEAHLNELFDAELEQQRQDGKDATEHSVRNKEANNGKRESGQSPVQHDGQSGQSGERTGVAAAGLDQGTGSQEGTGSQGNGADARGHGEVSRGPVNPDAVSADGETNFMEIHEEAWSDEMRAQIPKFKRVGITLRSALGSIPIPGTTRTCDGVSHLGVESIVQSDSPFFRFEQLCDHEAGHQYFFRDPALYQKCAREFRLRTSKAQRAELMKSYLGSYAGVYAQKTAKEQAKIQAAITEEIICDAYAGMNRSGANADQLQEFIKPIIDDWCAVRDAELESAEKRYSIDSMAEAVGLTFEKDGQMTVFKDGSGNRVDEVTEKMVQTSPLGAVIQSAVDKKFITDADAGKQITFFTELYNLMLKTQDIDLLWAVSSSIGFQPLEAGPRDSASLNQKSKFAGYTKNSDPQYSTTVDFTTICLKTQAVIDAMSATMMELGHGLTEDEIVNIVYRNTHEAGEPVPCPVCYVFSRWVGLGGLFDNMNNLQTQYANADLEVLRADIETLSQRIDEIMVKRGYALATGKGGSKSYALPNSSTKKSFGDAKIVMEKELMSRQLELQAKQNQDMVSGKKTMTKAEEAELAALKRDIQILDNWTWLTDVRLSENYTPVPPEILFDINAGKEFAERYPESWKFRTTRGPAMGKAATPYADEHLGQILRGAGASDLKKAELGDPAKNPFLKSKDGKLTPTAEKALQKSVAKIKAQNLLNGQRYQSTSDFRFEYALDYLLSFVEMQALGGKVQLYTKVAEAVRMFASIGAEVNCSLMPLGIGYRVTKDGSKTLTFSSVTGMNAEDAFNMSNEFDNVQPIMVGIGNEHIRLCMADDRITFIIPYHASGAGEARYVALMDIVGEHVEEREDYSNYQTDHKIEKPTTVQKSAYDLRLKLLTGKLGILSDADKQVLRDNEILHNLYKRFYGKDMDGNISDIDPKYLNPETRNSGKLFRDNECYGAFLTSDQAKNVMPFEYWDRTSTLDQADLNGQAFVEYCESLGLRPRFSGWDGNGVYHAEFDFSKESGYWKMLIDRSMYNRDGSYHEQQAINVTNFDAGFLLREESVKGIVQPSLVNDPAKTEKIAQKSADQVREKRGEKKFSANEYDTSGPQWAIREGILGKKDQAIFWRTIADVQKRGYNVPRTSTGEYIIDAGDRLLFTDADFKAPTLSRVIIINDRYENDMAFAKGWLYDAYAEGSESAIREALNLIDLVYREGYVEIRDAGVPSPDAREDRVGERADRGAAADRTEENTGLTTQASEKSGASSLPEAKYSVSDTKLSFADQVDLVHQNKLNEFLVPGTSGRNPSLLTNSAVYVTKEPNSFMQELGYGDLAIVVTQDHIRQMLGKREDASGNVVDEHNHQLSPRQVKILPKLLEKPAAVLRAKGRPESLIFVTTEKDYRGRPIIVPVKANGVEVVYNGISGPAHVVTSMYGRDNFDAFFENAVKQGQLVYYNKKRIDPILTAPGYQSSGLLSGIDSDTILGEVNPVVKDPGQRKYSITPQFEKWYKETYGTDLTSAQLKRRLQTAERRAAEAEHDKKAAELKNTIDSEMDLTAWMIHHTKKMREQKRASDAKLAEARKAKTEAVRTAVAETKEIERAKAEVQHDADRMAERRNAAKRLRTQENAYTNKVTEMKENAKLKRNAAKATLRDSRLAAKKRAEIESEQGLVDTIRKNPKQRTGVEKLQDAAQQLRTLGRSAYRNFVNMAESIDRFSKRQVSDMRAGTLVNILGGSASTMEAVFKKGLVDRAGNRIGESMSDVFLCWDEAHKKVNEGQQALLQDFMLHWHNIDRMSIVARAESALETFELNNEWLRDMNQKEFARLVAMTEKEVEKLGKHEAQQQAFEYVRLIRAYNEAQNKPIFADDKGNSVTAETSQRIVDQYLAEQPWLLDKANGIYEWWDLFMRNWAVGDTISEAEYNRMRQMYPHYVPTYRADKNGVGGAGFVGAGGATVSKAVKKAKGSHSEVMNIEDSFSNIVSKIIRLNRLNELYMNIIDTAMLDEDGTFADMAYFDWDWQDGAYANALITGSADIADLTDTVEETEKAGLEKVGSDYKLTGWLNGRKYTAYISEDLYKSIGMVTGHLANDLEQNLLKAGNTLTTPMKTAITGINPTFAIRNLSRDLPTAIINSISGLNFPKYYAQAAKEIATNSDHWKTFQALGGTHATYYNDNQGFTKAMSRGQNPAAWAVGKMGTFNEITEAQTRFAEYLATVDKLGDTYEARLQGIKNAAEVTVDFSRKGRYGKVINAWVPYWNPAVQGIDKTVRSVIDSPDGSAVWKQASKTLGRAAMTTVLFEAILYGVLKALDRDDEWEELNDRTKDTYYCIPLKDSNRFLKIPKNREWGAILGTPFMRMLEWANGREDPFENYIETAIEPNFLPPAIFRPDSGGGFASNIVGISQALKLAKNEDFAGRTIVPYAYQQGTLSQQFDNETSALAKKLGELFNWSPMQIDYIIGDYFGDFGDMFINATSEATWSGEQNIGETALEIVTNPFFADARYSNASVSKYYDLMDDLGRVVQDKKNQMGNDAAKETIEYQTEKAIDEMYGKQISELNRIVRELPDGTEKDNAKSQIAQLTKEAIEFYNDSMAGKVSNPIRTAEYSDFSESVSKELIRMDSYSGDYKFTPTGNPSAKYTDPSDKTREYILDDEQKDYFKQLYREKYDEIFSGVIQSSKYKNARDAAKAELLEDTRDDVLDATKEEFFEWLKASGVRSTKKQK